MSNQRRGHKIWSDAQLADVIALKRSGAFTWDEIAKKIERKYNVETTGKAMSRLYERRADTFEMSPDEFNVKDFQALARAKRTSSKNARENRLLADFLNTKEDVLDELKQLLKGWKSTKYKIPKPKRQKGKRKMTMEAMISDVHYGKRTDEFDLDVCRARLQKFTQEVVNSLDRNKKLYDVHRIIIALLGDIIESYTMHGLESAKGCEFGNSKQVSEAINSLFFDLILPLAQTGLQIDVPCVTGNHDRAERDRTFQNPGEENLTWIIYTMLEMLCKQTGLKNVTFHIAKGPYLVQKIYNDNVLYEHLDNAKSLTRTALESLMAQRTVQTKLVLNYLRGGHFHEYTVFGRGKIIVNGSIPGKDSYADVKGFDSESLQVINLYVDTNHRPTTFYHSFPVYLGDS